MSCLSTVTEALELYYIPESLKKNDSSNLITKSPESKELESEISNLLKVNNIKDEFKTFEYYKKSASTGFAETSHVVGIIKPRFKNSIEVRKKTLIKYQESVEVVEQIQSKRGTKEILSNEADKFGIEEDKHKAFKYYKKSTNTDSGSRKLMNSNYYYDAKDLNRLYTPKPCSKKVQARKIIAFNLDMNSSKNDH
ncbi:hypothetical protein C2G38_2152392 [Gigaspora rosea]|uniref:Uncharacterized protein n=1 Tax=Gigaspora rosea TaxID=44941 RepID=A0A397W7B4_9GLOM|nr:hypothetical protein C2G38_2152392 [Gigaspora rosea]